MKQPQVHYDTNAPSFRSSRLLSVDLGNGLTMVSQLLDLRMSYQEALKLLASKTFSGSVVFSVNRPASESSNHHAYQRECKIPPR